MRATRTLLLAALAATAAAEEERVLMKIVEGLPKPKATYGGGSSSPSAPVPPTPDRAPREPGAGTPVHLLALRGRCFASNIGKYKYEVCPFDNATQLDTYASWNQFYGLLGVWDGWEEGSGFTVGRFTDGTKCGSTPRTVTVAFKCIPEGQEARIADVLEPETCKYTAELHAPEICAPEEGEVAATAAATEAGAGAGAEEEEEEGGSDDPVLTGAAPEVYEGAATKEEEEEEVEEAVKSEDGPGSVTETHAGRDSLGEASVVSPTAVEALMAENERLRQEVERLRARAEAIPGAASAPGDAKVPVETPRSVAEDTVTSSEPVETPAASTTVKKRTKTRPKADTKKKRKQKKKRKTKRKRKKTNGK